MLNPLRDRVAALRNPEYTGANRCRPCTVVNVAIAVVIAVGLLAVSAAVAAAALVVALAAIALRGYLVPGTPELTARYLPTSLRSWFGKSAHRPGVVADVREPFRRAGAVDGSGRLAPSFRADWGRAIERSAGADDLEAELAAFLDVDPAAVRLRAYDDGVSASVRGVGAGRWASREAMTADLAAARLLADRGVRTDADVRRLREQVGDLRSGLTSCPLCGTDLVVEETTAVACCGARTASVIVCPACAVRWFEGEPERPTGDRG